MPLTIDDIPSVVVPTPVKESEVVYAANLAGGDALLNYQTAKQEIALTGDSTLVNTEKNKWLQEQIDSNKKTVEELITDASLPVQQRRKVMEAYVQGAIPLQDLRQKFLVKTAINDVAQSVEDRQAQDEYATNVHLRDEDKMKIEREKLLSGQASSLSNFIPGVIDQGPPPPPPTLVEKLKGFGDAGVALLAAIPTSFVGMPYGVLKDVYQRSMDLPTRGAAEYLSDIMQYSYSPKTVTGEEYLRKATNILGSLPPVIPEVTAIMSMRQGMSVVRGKPTVPHGSAIDTIETASKEQATNITARAMADTSSEISKSLGTTKEQILNSYILPKIEEEFGPIVPDAREGLIQLDKALTDLAIETEISPHVYPVSQIIKERDLYTKVLTETERPHLLLSSSVLDISPEAKLFGRAGKDYEALVESRANKLTGTAVFGRNANYGYKTEAWANKYLNKLKESTSHLPDQGEFDIIERDGQYYVSWKFQREYQPHESLIFGEDTLSAHLFSKKVDITEFANSTVGKAIFPNYMRMKEDIPAQGAAAAREEARIESVFLREARDTFMKTKNPKELEISLRKGEDMGQSFTADDIAMQHPHLDRATTDQIHAEYVAYRRIVDHLYVLSDRRFRKGLESKNMKSLYDNNGEFVAHTTDPIKELPEGVTRVWDLEKKQVVQADRSLKFIQLESAVKEGDHIVNYAIMPSKFQHGPVRAGALTQIPGYIPRTYKEWFVVEKIPKALWVDGKKVGQEELRNYKQAIAMAGNRNELETLMEKYKTEEPNSNFEFRKEEKDINDKIIHDSKVYDTYLKQIHRRGERLPSLNRPAEVEDVLVSLTKAVRGVAKVTAWDDLTKVRRDNFVKAYGKFTQGKFPDQINEIKPLVHMTAKEERELLAAQSVYAHLEMEQIASIESDIVWRNGLNKIADVFEKTKVDASVLREWGEAGFIPARTVKALGSNLFLYWRIPRMWIVQPQQWKELIAISPSYTKHLHEIMPILQGVLARTHTLKAMRSQVDSMGRRIMPDYDRVINALEESAIMQTVDMNQMVHGIWKDATQELAPKPVTGVLGAIDKGIRSVDTAVGLPGKIGRGLGYNPGELTNQISLWLFARHRWMEKNPGKNWDLPENRAQIARDQSIYAHMSSTRAGMYPWQEGMISMFTQFVAIPWKSTLQMVSMHSLTGPEKARLAGARLFWYGKYGIPLGAGIYKVLENNIEDKQDRDTLAAWTESATDRIWNATLYTMFDASNEKSNVDTKSLSTVIDGEFIWDTMNTLIEMGKGNTVEAPKITFPYENATGSIMNSVRTIYDIFKINDKGATDLDTWKAASWQAVSFAGTFSDFNKAMLAEGMSKSGNAVGYQQTRGEAVARLFGVPPKEESLLNMANLSQIKRQQEIKNTAKQIHERLIAVMKAKSVDEIVKQKEYLDGLASFLNTVPEYYKTELTTEILKLDRYSWKEKKESILINLYKNGMDKNDTKYLEMRNALEKSNDPEIKDLLKDLENVKIRGIK